MSKKKETAFRPGYAPIKQHHVLIVDDEADILELLELTLVRMGIAVDRAMSVNQAKKFLSEQKFDLCLTDMRLPDGNGLEIVEWINQSGKDIPAAVITAYGSAENAVAALKAGAFDYLAKPVSLDQLRALIKSALSLHDTPKSMTESVASPLMGLSPLIEEVRERIEKLARSEAPVYITGESGCGKELAARLIHNKCVRMNGPFVPVNCGAIPENLMESEFFGYKKGAFTGADQDRDGFFQAANGGTLFLDEVADLPIPMQVKLLRVIQEKKARKIGDPQEESVHARIISATHKNLAACVKAGTFRQDLYYRLNVIELRMPPLRERPEDIPLLTEAIMQRLAKQLNQAMPELLPDAISALQNYRFPGNVRELENILERAFALHSDNQITMRDLQLEQLEPSQDEDISQNENTSFPPKWPLQPYMDAVEKSCINEALLTSNYNRTDAAKLLGMPYRALVYRMERLGIE